MNRKRKILAGALTAALLLTLSIPAFATSGDVAGAVEQTWTSAQGQIKTVVNNVVFPVLDVVLAVLFFVKVGSSYGIQLSLSTLASMCSIMVLGILLKNPASAFIFLSVFFFLRLFSGGYHATTYARCFLLTNSVYLAVVGASYWIVHFQLYHLLPVIVVVSCVVVMALSPIRNKRHPLSEKTYRKNRKIAVVLVSIECSLFLLLFFWRIFPPYVIVSTMSLAAVAVMMLVTLNGRRVKQ